MDLVATHDADLTAFGQDHIMEALNLAFVFLDSCLGIRAVTIRSLG